MKNWLQKLEKTASRIYHFIAQEVWRIDVSKQGSLRRMLYQTIMIGFLVIRGFFKERVWIRASSLVYSSLLAIVPIMAVVFSLLKGFGFAERLFPILENTLSPLGPRAVTVIMDQIKIILEELNVSALGGIGFLVLLFSIISVVGNIEGAFNDIWQIRKSRSFQRRVSDYFSVLLLGPVLLIVIPGFTAYIQRLSFIQSLTETTGVNVLIRRSWPLLASWLAFLLFYLFIPNTKVKMTSAFIGAVAAGTLWQIANFGFTHFIVTSYTTGSKAALYSGFATFPLFLIWLYLSWAVILLGGEICFTHQNHKFLGWQFTEKKYSQESTELIALKLLLIIAEHFHFGKQAPSSSELSERLQVPEPTVDSMLQTLREARLIYPVEETEVRYCPSTSLNNLYVLDFFNMLRSKGDDFDIEKAEDVHNKIIRDIHDQYQKAINQTFLNTTIEKLLLVAHQSEEKQ